MRHDSCGDSAQDRTRSHFAQGGFRWNPRISGRIVAHSAVLLIESGGVRIVCAQQAHR